MELAHISVKGNKMSDKLAVENSCTDASDSVKQRQRASLNRGWRKDGRRNGSKTGKDDSFT